ncbi:MAG: hypothetical protein HY080_07655 [Gammaproteobacteria bacterium]|nr:hypothetical protein [Gammaproteobacteria bacterium]
MGKQNSSVFELNAPGLNLRLRLSGPDQEDWLSAVADVSTVPFSGTYVFQILSSELQALLENLQELERSVGKEFEINWENCESNIKLKLSLNSRGQLIGYYRLAAGLGWEGANLSGQFHADQSYLRGWVQQLKQVQRELG